MVKFSNFQMLNSDATNTTHDLFDSSVRQRSSFTAFATTWMAFNGWMEAVTDEATDAAMLSALGESRRIMKAYDELLESSSQFRHQVMTFAEMWPVANVRDLRRKLGRDAFVRLSSGELLQECLAKEVKFQPVGWSDGDTPTWPQLLRTIYAIRCNMFHGSKSPYQTRDRDLVRHAERVLRTFIEETRCFDWHD
ncbi:hypothetical protein CK489_25030 [Bradyrhizobium sp. UFLA03-84]|nr:hypothetical protein CK489_25030 [Bradyrhizobium sp. UFLA03-84]